MMSVENTLWIFFIFSQATLSPGFYFNLPLVFPYRKLTNFCWKHIDVLSYTDETSIAMDSEKIKATPLLTSGMGTRSWVNKTTSSVRLGRMDERILKLHPVLSSDQSNWMIIFKKTFLGKRFLKNLQPVISGDFV